MRICIRNEMSKINNISIVLKCITKWKCTHLSVFCIRFFWLYSIQRIISLNFRSNKTFTISIILYTKAVSFPLLTLHSIWFCTKNKRFLTIVIHRIFFIHIYNVDDYCWSLLYVHYWKEKPLSQIVLIVLVKLKI